MEEVIQKLSEIETTAQHIMEEAEQQKQILTEDMKKQIQAYDKQAEQEASKKIAQIRKSLEENKESQLAALNQKTQETLKSLDQYYDKNHERLAQEIFKKITQS